MNIRENKLQRFLILYLLLFFIFPFFWNCEKDDETVPQATQTPNLLSGIRKDIVSFSELEEDRELSEITQKLFFESVGNSSARSGSRLELADAIDEENITKFTLDDYTSYTIPVKKENARDDYFQNIVVEKSDSREAAYLFTYFPDEDYKEAMGRGYVDAGYDIDYSGDSEIKQLYYEETSRASDVEGGTVIDCIVTHNPGRNCTAGGNHTPAQTKRCTGSSGQLPIPPSVDIYCFSSGSGSGGEKDLAVAPIPEPDYIPRCITCSNFGGGGGRGKYKKKDTQRYECKERIKVEGKSESACVLDFGRPIISTPAPETLLYKYKYILKLTDSELDWVFSAESRDRNFEDKMRDFVENSRIVDFGAERGGVRVRFPKENSFQKNKKERNAANITFIKRAVSVMMYGSEESKSEMLADLDALLKQSPIDARIINQLTGKVKCVYDKLQRLSGGFRGAIQKFDGEFPVAHLKLTINNNLPTGNYGVTKPPINYTINIEFSNTQLSNISDLGAAVAFAHEVIHAEIYRKMLSAAQLGDLNLGQYTTQNRINYINSLRNNFSGIYDYYVKRYRPTWNHNMTAQHYRTVIAEIVEEFDNHSLTKEVYEDIAWAGLRIINNLVTNETETSIAWDNLSTQEKSRIISNLSNYFHNGVENCN